MGEPVLRLTNWSGKVTATSNAMDLEGGVFSKSDPKAIARSVLASARRSKRKKRSAFASAMHMISFYQNRAGKRLPAERKRVLQQAKEELRKMATEKDRQG